MFGVRLNDLKEEGERVATVKIWTTYYIVFYILKYFTSFLFYIGILRTSFELGKKFTSLEEIGNTPVVIYEEKSKKAFFGSTDQNLGFDALSVALQKTNTVLSFRLEKSGSNYLLRGITPDGSEYNIWGSPGYLNSQPVDGWCSFILGLNNQNGQDIKDGAVWDIQYESGKGFSLKNVGTGKYLQDALPAKYDDPMYFSFYSLKGI